HGFSIAELREQALRLPFTVVLDDGVGGAENRVRGAVVLLERDRRGTGEVALEVENVRDVGTAKRVHGLIGVSNSEDVAVLTSQQLEEPVLGVVRVLVLVDEDVAERLLPALAGFREALEH